MPYSINENDKLGEGGFGIVYKATSESEQVFACKVLSGDNENDKKRFDREVKLLSQLKHRNIIQIISISTYKNQPCYIMELADFSLAQYIKKPENMIDRNLNDRIKIFQDILNGIEYAHRNGVLHRDLKPENILFIWDNNLRIVISDFGLGRLIDSTSTKITGDGIGTLEFSAPEQFNPPYSADKRSDIYALGKILYKLLTGKNAYQIDNASIPTKFKHIISKATEFDPERRYQTINELSEGLEYFLKPIESSEAPVITGKKLLIQIDENPESEDNVNELINLILKNTNDYTLLLEVFPKIPKKSLDYILSECLDKFIDIFNEYDKTISGYLAFDYCDIVANFYSNVFFISTNLDIRILIIPLCQYT
jgi:serine/threonine protein kinase